MLDDLSHAVAALASIGHAARVLQTTHSTNDDARGWASEGAPHGAVVIADAQTAGRGRHGRPWSSPPGASLAMSIVLRPDLAPARLPPLALVAGLAARHAIAARLDRRVAVKWPNDVVVQRAGRALKKIAGVLVEASIAGSKVDHVVVGIGINVARDAFPPELADRATSLALEGAIVGSHARDRGALAVDVVRALDDEMAIFLDDSSSIGARLSPHDALLDVRVRLDDGRRGTANGIEPDGRLRVRLDDGAIAFALAGEVVVES